MFVALIGSDMSNVMLQQKGFITLVFMLFATYTIATGDNKIEKAFQPIPNQNEVFCPAIGYFLNTETAFEPRPLYKNDSKMCTFVENSCCSAYEMDSIRNWWETKPKIGNQRSRFETKKERLYLIESFTYDLLGKREFFTDYATQIKESQDKNFEGYCKDHAKKYLESDFSELNNYLKYTETCWSTMNKIQNGIMCFTCEPFAQGSLGFEDKSLTLGDSVLKLLSNDCKELAWTMHRVMIPYFLMVNKLMKCDPETGKELDEIMVFNYNAQGNQYLDEVPGQTILEAKIDEKMFPQFFSFGTRINVNIEGKLDYLMSLVRLVRGFIAKVSIEKEESLKKNTETITNSQDKVKDQVKKTDDTKVVEAPQKEIIPVEEKLTEKPHSTDNENAITKEKAIEMLNDYCTELEQDHKNTQEINDLLVKKKDEIQMSIHIAEDAVLAVAEFKYEKISAKEALEQLKDKIDFLQKANKVTIVQENYILKFKQQLINKVRPDQPYVFMKKLKAFKWKRPISDEEVQREIDLAVDQADMNYVYAQNVLNRPYNQKEAREIIRVAYDDAKHMMMEKLTRPDKPFPVKFSFKQELNEIEISERVDFYKLKRNVKPDLIKKYEGYLKKFRFIQDLAKVSSISNLMGRRLFVTNEMNKRYYGKDYMTRYMKTYEERRLAKKEQDDNDPDSAKVKKGNFGIDFKECRGHVDEEEKRNKEVKAIDYNKDMTMKDRFCLAMRQVVSDWRNSNNNKPDFRSKNKSKDLKKKLRESVQCADWDETMTGEEKKMIKDVDENTDFELKMLPGDNSSKKSGQAKDKDEKCLDRKDKKMEYIIKYIDKFELPTDYEKCLSGKDTCQYYKKILKPMKYFYEKCFEKSDGDKIVNNSTCIKNDRLLRGGIPPETSMSRILASDMLKTTMKTFDTKFKAQKKFSKNDFKHLRRLYKKKFIQRRLKTEGHPLKFVINNDITFDIGKTDFMIRESGFGQIKIDRELVKTADIEKLLRNIRDEDINEVDGPEEINKDSEDDEESYSSNKRSASIEQNQSYNGIAPFEQISIDKDVPLSRNLNAAGLYSTLSITMF